MYIVIYILYDYIALTLQWQNIAVARFALPPKPVPEATKRLWSVFSPGQPLPPMPAASGKPVKDLKATLMDTEVKKRQKKMEKYAVLVHNFMCDSRRPKTWVAPLETVQSFFLRG